LGQPGAKDAGKVAKRSPVRGFKELLDACEDFVRKVECGQAQSTRSYQQMKAAIAKAKGQP
jgi:hypothetical protein